MEHGHDRFGLEPFLAQQASPRSADGNSETSSFIEAAIEKKKRCRTCCQARTAKHPALPRDRNAGARLARILYRAAALFALADPELCGLVELLLLIFPLCRELGPCQHFHYADFCGALAACAAKVCATVFSTL